MKFSRETKSTSKRTLGTITLRVSFRMGSLESFSLEDSLSSITKKRSIVDNIGLGHSLTDEF